MRRGSLVGPLLLIGVGALFLARNVMPDLPLLDYLAQYWPFLLILWGSLRLLEIATWSVRGKPLPAYGISGGEWVLVVFLCMFGLSLHAVRGFTSWFPAGWIDVGGLEVFGESYDYPVSAEAPAGAKGRVVIEGFRGNARVIGTDNASVKVTGRQTIRSVDRATADRSNAEAVVQVHQDGDQVVVRPASFHSSEIFRRGARRISADLEIAVPKGSTVVINGRDGDFDVSAVAGSVDIDTENASARVENIGGDVRVTSSGGNIVRAVNVAGSFELKGRGSDVDLEKVAGQVTVSGSWSGLVQMRELAKPVRWNGLQTTITMQGLPGDLRMTIGDITATGVMGPLRIDSQNKDLDLTDVSGSTTVTLQRGDVRVAATTAPVGDVNVRLNGGNVDVALPDKARFSLDAVTQRGEAFNDYGSEVMQDADGRRGAKLSTSMSGPRVEIRVERGDITVRRGGPISSIPAVPKLPPTPAPAPIAQ